MQEVEVASMVESPTTLSMLPHTFLFSSSDSGTHSWGHINRYRYFLRHVDTSTWMYLAPWTQVSRLSVPEIISAWAAAVSFPRSVPASSNCTSSDFMSWNIFGKIILNNEIGKHIFTLGVLYSIPCSTPLLLWPLGSAPHRTVPRWSPRWRISWPSSCRWGRSPRYQSSHS